MFRNLDRWGPMTVLLVAVALIVVLVGAISVLTGGYDDDVRRWIDDLVELGYAIAGLAAARAVKLGADRVAESREFVRDLEDDPDDLDEPVVDLPAGGPEPRTAHTNLKG